MDKTFEEFLNEKKGQEFEYRPARSELKNTKGHATVGYSFYGPEKNLKGANIQRHKETGKFFASGGSSTAITKATTFHDTPEEAAAAYHAKQKA
jgi:hypothetical protein